MLHSYSFMRRQITVNICISIFTGEKIPQMVPETISSKEKLYLDTLARTQNERAALQISRKAMEPQIPRDIHNRRKSFKGSSPGKSSSTIGIRYSCTLMPHPPSL